MRRRRRAEDASGATGAGVQELLDDDEQTEVVASLEKEGMQQIQFMNRVFGIICCAGMAAAVAVACFVAQDTKVDKRLLWMHVVYASAMFHGAGTHVDVSPNRPSVFSSEFLLALTALPLIILSYDAKTNDTFREFHWGLAFVTLLVTVGSVLMRRDSLSTIRALEELNASKYRFKSI